MPEFKDKVVMITGAAGSLGLTTAKMFHELGATLALLDIQTEALKNQFNKTTHYIHHLDLMDSISVQTAVDDTLSRYDHIDVLVNIAGGFRMGTKVHETSDDDWHFMLNLNAKSVFNMCRAVLPPMLKLKQGKIINIAARAGLQGKAKMATYIASKSAVIRLTESMAAEYKTHQININCILPGTIDTEDNRKDMPNADYSQWVPTQQIADVIAFLSSEKAIAIHGASLPVYGLS